MLFKQKVKNKIGVIIGLATIMIGMLSCEELPCPGDQAVMAKIGFYEIDGSIINDFFIDSFNVEYLNSGSSYIDTFFTERNSIDIPLSINSDSTTIVIKYKNTTTDTLLLKSERTLKLISHECGFDTFFEINELETTQNQLDSAWLRRDIVDYAELENIKIYY
jgi:hypothetical protein